MNNNNIGFVGVGFMGYGMALNLLNKDYNLFLVAHKNRKSIDKLIKKGAKEIDCLENLAKNCKVIIMCVSNTPVANEVIDKIIPYLNKQSIIIDITTHKAGYSTNLYNKLLSLNIHYVVSPVMGGPVQAQEGILGAIVGCDKSIYKYVENILLNFCKNVFYFGNTETAVKAKLISNFLSLGTTTFVIETLKAANKFNIDLIKLYEVSKLGSGNSGALKRIAEKAIKNNYKGYVFSVNNTLKDLTYINELLKDIPNAEKLSAVSKSIYEDAKNKGHGNLLISELIINE